MLDDGSSSLIIRFRKFSCELSSLLGDLHGLLERSVVHRLEDVFVELCCLGAIEWHLHDSEGIRETLDADADGAMLEVAGGRFLDGVEVVIDDLVEILGDDFHHSMETFEIECLIGVDEGWKTHRSQVANGNLIWRCELLNLTAEI